MKIISLQPTQEGINKQGIYSLSKLICTELSLDSKCPLTSVRPQVFHSSITHWEIEETEFQLPK